jgi:hypothetical protein
MLFATRVPHLKLHRRGRDMFGWFKRSKTPAPQPEAAAPPAPSAPVVAPAAPAAKPPAAATPPPAPAPTGPTPAVNGQQPARRSTASRATVPPKGYKEPEPAAGMIAVEVAPARVREAVVTRVAADGRRVMARIGGTTRTIWYSRRKDGTYRLESTPSAKAPRLILGLDLAAQKRAPQIRLPH